MRHRIATLFLLLIICGFFVFHKISKDNKPPVFSDTIEPKLENVTFIARDEFLILMDQGDEKHFADVLTEFDLRVISPLGEWVHVGRNRATEKQNIVPFYSAFAQENQKLLAQIEAHPAVHSAQLNYIQNTSASVSCTPHTHAPSQWYLSKATGIDLPGAWSITQGNPRIVIGLVDRNFDFYQPKSANDSCESRNFYFKNVMDMFPQTYEAPSFEEIPHGAYVMGVVASCIDHDHGLLSVDKKAQVFAVDTKFDKSLSARLFAILWAAGVDICHESIVPFDRPELCQKNSHPANVINASFGFGGPYLSDPPYGPVLDVIGRVNRQGAIVIASAGNEGSLADRRLPGSAGGVISVGASNKKKQSARFSNFGRTVDVLAPGEGIIGFYRGELVSLNGTSFAAPLLTGTASLMVGEDPMLSWKHVEYMVKETASPISCDDYCPMTLARETRDLCRNYCCSNDQVICARGIADAYDAVAMATKGLPKVALIDVDDYYLALSDDNDLKTQLVIKNWGRKTAIVRMKETDRHLHMAPKSLSIPPISENGIPGLGKVTIFYDEKPRVGVVSGLILEASNSDTPHLFHDRIESIVEIVPDEHTRRDRKILMDLPPEI